MAIRYSDAASRTDPGGSVPVELLRIAANTTHIVLSLSAEIGGCLTHWDGSRSRYCPGTHAGCKLHKNEAIWKGYICALVLNHSKEWNYKVVELTEHCEPEMRQVYARGQLWEFTRPDERRGKRGPVTARLIESKTERALPPAFDVRRVLVQVFHCHEIDLSSRNPMPPRLVLPSIPDVELVRKGAQS